MKLLQHNVNYFLGFDGSLRKYVRHCTRGVRADRAAERENMEAFADLVVDERPDVVFLTEVDMGSIRTRTRGQPSMLRSMCSERGLELSSSAANKYAPGSILSRLPVLRHMANGVLYGSSFETQEHYIGPGSKQLVYEARKDGLSLFSVHLPLLRRARRKQLENLAELVAQRDRVIVTGDFNNYHGESELQPLLDAGLVLESPGPTLRNSMLPYREIDPYLCSPELDVTGCGRFDLPISDHYCTWLEVDTDA